MWGYGPVCKIRARRDAMSYFSPASSLIWVGDSKTKPWGWLWFQYAKIHARRDALSDFSPASSKTNFEGSYGPVCKIHALRDPLPDFSPASSLIWVGDSKTNFEGSYGPVCKIHARRDAVSNFLGLVTARHTFGTFCTAVLMSLIQGWDVDPLPDLSICWQMEW